MSRSGLPLGRFKIDHSAGQEMTKLGIKPETVRASAKKLWDPHHSEKRAVRFTARSNNGAYEVNISALPIVGQTELPYVQLVVNKVKERSPRDIPLNRIGAPLPGRGRR